MEGTYHYGDDRNPNQFQGGRGIPGRSARTTNRNYCAYNHQMEGLSWADQRHFEERPDQSRRGQTTRSANWKNQKAKKNPATQEKRDEEKRETGPEKDYSSKKETKPMDEPLYNVSGFGASIAVQEEYYQNFDFSGFPQIVDRTYEELKTCDERLTRSMPKCMFNHAMTTFANAVLIDRDQENGHRTLNQNDFAEDAFPQSFPIPAPIHDYL
ncbi:hypothetical protein GE061_016753 [Apolygus lucorum]|uniref:Uncharacterized protein n=1 Tax=Apolygus lucorum TaxID=248454 RepID=A0A8S9XI82_APOLU|nr:hypothetical protein GE061_016753 [Apolygus lucorum]